jgi:hypothetical protein
MEPAINPATGRFPATVRKTNSQGDMMLSDEDKKTNKHFIADTDSIEIYDGKSFNLEDEVDAAWWEAIRYSKQITQDRWTKDHKGDYIIDGDTKRYGTAEYYIERPGQETKSRNSRKREVFKATEFIYGDSSEGLYLKAKLLGNSMFGMPESDVEDFLVSIANKTPDKITELYTGTDTHLRILLLEATEKRVIIYKNKIYSYGEDIMLGGTQEAVLLWMKNPSNKSLVEMIKKETYPEMFDDAEEVHGAPPTSTRKQTAKA